MAKNNKATARQGGFDINKVRTARPASRPPARLRADNDNREQVRTTVSRPQKAANDNASQKILATARAGRSSFFILSISLMYYPLRLFSSILLLAAFAGLFAISDTWIGWFDIFDLGGAGFSGLMVLAIGINVALSILTFIIANGVYLMNRINPWQDIRGLVFVPLLLGLNALPILSFIEPIWVWLVFVVKTQVETGGDAV